MVLSSMRPARSSFRLLVAIIVVVALGMSTRRSFAPPFVQLYVGDVLWGALFFLLGALAWPRQSSLLLAVAAIVTTELIELSQLCQADWMLQLRATRLGGLLLGHQFLWSDVCAVAIGGALAALLDASAQRFSAAR